MSIPTSAAPFFQEYDFQKLDPQEHGSLIIERILAYGNRAELRWLVQTYGWDSVRDWIIRMGASRLPKSRYNLWCIIFDLPHEERSKRLWPH
jgi:hypothetical protein